MGQAQSRKRASPSEDGSNADSANNNSSRSTPDLALHRTMIDRRRKFENPKGKTKAAEDPKGKIEVDEDPKGKKIEVDKHLEDKIEVNKDLKGKKIEVDKDLKDKIEVDEDLKSKIEVDEDLKGKIEVLQRERVNRYSRGTRQPDHRELQAAIDILEKARTKDDNPIGGFDLPQLSEGTMAMVFDTTVRAVGLSTIIGQLRDQQTKNRPPEEKQPGIRLPSSPTKDFPNLKTPGGVITPSQKEIIAECIGHLEGVSLESAIDIVTDNGGTVNWNSDGEFKLKVDVFVLSNKPLLKLWAIVAQDCPRLVSQRWNELELNFQ